MQIRATTARTRCMDRLAKCELCSCSAKSGPERSLPIREAEAGITEDGLFRLHQDTNCLELHRYVSTPKIEVIPMHTVVALLLCLLTPFAQRNQNALNDPNAPRAIGARDTVWIEEMTWLEVHDAIKAGKTTALILTGGIEQNG